MDDLLHQTGMGCFDFDGKPISILEWKDLWQDPRRRVALDVVGGYRISTLWIGVHLDGAPRIYETMVFCDGEPDRARRYHTRAEAERGHEEMVAMMKGLN